MHDQISDMIFLALVLRLKSSSIVASPSSARVKGWNFNFMSQHKQDYIPSVSHLGEAGGEQVVVNSVLFWL